MAYSVKRTNSSLIALLFRLSGAEPRWPVQQMTGPKLEMFIFCYSAHYPMSYLQLTAPDSSTKRVERWPAYGLFTPSLQKQPEHNKHQSPGGLTDCYTRKEKFGEWSYDAEKSMGRFFAPLNPEKLLAAVWCHCGRWAGKCGWYWNGACLGNQHRHVSFLFYNEGTVFGVMQW